jgi:hypothetical protein
LLSLAEARITTVYGHFAMAALIQWDYCCTSQVYTALLIGLIDLLKVTVVQGVKDY